MTSHIQQADRRVADYQEQLDKLRNRAKLSAEALNDVGLMRATLERIVDIASKPQQDAISIAIAHGQVRECLYDFAEAVQTVKKADELRRQIDALRPLTTQESKVD